MNTSTLLAQARKDFEEARNKAAADERTARLARQTAQAAKVKLKQSRKLAKLAKKAARKADDRAEHALEALDRAQTKVEKLERRMKKEQRKEEKAKDERRKSKAEPIPSGVQKRARRTVKRRGSRQPSGTNRTSAVTPLAAASALLASGELSSDHPSASAAASREPSALL